MVERVTTKRPAANDDVPPASGRAASRRADKAVTVSKPGFDKKTIALVYDFDGTLSPKPMQEYTVLPKLNEDAKAFWAESNRIAKEQGADPLITYMHLMYKKAKEHNVRIDREDLVQLGRDVELFAGVEEWFATTYGPIRFVVLNDTVSSASVITGVERAFLDVTLKGVDRARTPFVVAMHHQPMYTTSIGHAPATNLRAAWTPLYDQYHVNAVLNGHVHSYESTKPMAGGTGTSLGTPTTDALGTRYLVFGGGGADLYGFKTTQPYIQKRESVHGFAVMRASSTELTWTAFRDDGSTIESFAIPK